MSEQHPFHVSRDPLPLAEASPGSGMVLLVLAMCVVPVMDGMAKYLMQSLPALQVVWARYFFHFLVFLPFVLVRHGRGTFRTRRPGLQFMRGMAMFVSTIFFFFAISLMPLADALAVLFVYPFIVTALSPWALGDRVGLMRWAAVSVGFLGALIIIRPGFSNLSVGTLLALLAGFGYAVYVLGTRRIRGADPALVTLLWSGLFGTVVTTLIVPFVWQTPTLAQVGMMAGIGAIGALAHYMIILAYERATAPQLAPYGYVEIVAATAVGYVAFGDFPDLVTWFGITLIIASGLFIAWREAVRGVVR